MLLVVFISSCDLTCLSSCGGLAWSDGVVTTVWSSAFNAAARAHWSVIERLRSHRHDAEGVVRLPQAQVWRPVSNSWTLL